MTITYPAVLDVFGDVPSGGTQDVQYGGRTHPQKHNDTDAAIVALENKLGIGASLPAGVAAVLRRTAAGASAWGQVVGGDIAGGGTANRVLATADGANVALQQILSAMIGAGQLLDSHFSVNTIHANKIQDGTIGTAQIADRQIGTNDLNGGGVANRLLGTSDGVNASYLQANDSMFAGSSIHGNKIQTGTLTGTQIQDGTIAGIDLAAGAATAMGYVAVPSQSSSGTASTIIASMTTPTWQGTGIGLGFICFSVVAPVNGASVQLSYQLDGGGLNTVLGPWNHFVAGLAGPVMAAIPIVAVPAGNHTHSFLATFASGGSWSVYSGYMMVMELRK